MEIKISIITINLNNKIGLEKTIQSVINQSYSHIEYIIIDGNSTDGSQELLSNPKIFKAISESDSGIYNAMNKGIQLVSGEYCLFLNSGDFLVDMNVIEKVAQIIIERNSQDDIIYGDLYFDGKYYNYPDKLSLDFFREYSLPHPASFIKSKIFNRNWLGNYMEDFKIVADWIFFLKAYTYQLKFYHISTAVSVFNTDGISSIQPNLVNIERVEGINKYFPNFITDFKTLEQNKKLENSNSHIWLEKILFYYRKFRR